MEGEGVLVPEDMRLGLACIAVDVRLLAGVVKWRIWSHWMV